MSGFLNFPASRVFFSVDVETSDLTPWDGELLTVGVEAVGADLSNLGEFYARINAPLDRWWYAPEDHPYPGDDGPSDTALWWMEQDEAARNEAWADTSLVRHNPHTAARMLAEFVVERAPQPEDRVFVANPVAFDKMWIDSLYGQLHGAVKNPFHYRSLCLRSMKFGLRARSQWGNDRENHAPKIPHHALWDAKAQADDLRDMLRERDQL